MKKILLVCLCFFLVGCQPQIDKENWVGEYQYQEIVLIIEEVDDLSNGFQFTMNYQGRSYEGFTRYQGDDKKEAISDSTEDGYTLFFTFQGDSVIVKESDGFRYLGTDLSGEYVKQ